MLFWLLVDMGTNQKNDKSERFMATYDPPSSPRKNKVACNFEPEPLLGQPALPRGKGSSQGSGPLTVEDRRSGKVEVVAKPTFPKWERKRKEGGGGSSASAASSHSPHQYQAAKLFFTQHLSRNWFCHPSQLGRHQASLCACLCGFLQVPSPSVHVNNPWGRKCTF